MKFTVKEVGKIKEASFDINDLTIFVGKNGTNKSYIANIVYKLNKLISEYDPFYMNLSFDNTLFNNYLTENSNYLEDIRHIKRKELIEDKTEEIDEDIIQTYSQRRIEFNIENSEELIEDIVKGIFEYINKILLIKVNRNFNCDINIVKEINLYVENIRYKNKITVLELIEWDGSKGKNSDIMFLKYIFDDILRLYNKKQIAKYEYYFPASRTGFVLALDEIASGLFKDYGIKNSSTTKLTEATSDFVSKFMEIKLGKFKEKTKELASRFNKNIEMLENIAHILNFINKRLIHGEIIQEKGEDFENFYLNVENREKIELHLSSSATLELLPLVAFLKKFTTLEDKLLIIEEPEAHLHPKAQIELARLIVMLVNAGAKVLITTHSDYIISEISNCIKLSSVNKNELKNYLNKYELSKDIMISKDRVSTYLFKDKRDEVEVKELNIDRYGIDNENFDEVIDELLDRTQEINENIEG